MLESQRKKIDRIDLELIELLQERMEVVNEIIEIKLENNIPVLDKTREEKQMYKIATSLKDSPYKESVLAVFASILEVSKKYQQGKVES